MDGTPRTTRNSAPRTDPLDAVALAHVLTHAAHVGLPMPVDVHLGVGVASLGGPAVRFDMATIADLAEWSLYLEQPIHTEPLTAEMDHHTIEGEVLELPVRLIATVRACPVVTSWLHDLVETQPLPYLVPDGPRS